VCRQTLTEFADDLPVLLVNDKGERASVTLKELFPYSFTKSFLDR
jgi:cytidine deaminase